MLSALEAGVTYSVAVTSYLDDFSPFPYGVRLRVDESAALPQCRVGDRVFPNALPATPGTSTIPVDANTLYVTNVQWMTGEFGATVSAIARCCVRLRVAREEALPTLSWLRALTLG